MKAISVSSALNTMQRQQRAEAGRRQRRDDRQRMRQALVEHAEHDVDREQRRQDQQRLRADRAARRPARRRRIRRGSCPAGAVRPPRWSIAAVRRLERDVRREVEGDGHRRELALVVDDQRRQRRARPAPPPTAAPARRRRRRHRRCVRSDGSRWNCGSTSRMTRYWLRGRVDGRDLPLREGVVQRVVDVLDAHAEPRGRRAGRSRRWPAGRPARGRW